MSYSPPTKKTVMLSFICLLIGIVLGILGFLGLVGDLSQIIVYIAFGLCFFAWLLMYIGVRFRGV